MEEVWGLEDTPVTEVTVSQLNELCKKFTEFKNEKDEKKKELAEIQARIDKVEAKIIEYLSEFGMKNFGFEGGKAVLVNHVTYKQPEGPEKQSAFYEYLKERGAYEDLLTINSRTLSGWVKKEVEAKKTEGVEGWLPPGISKPEEYKTVRIDGER